MVLYAYIARHKTTAVYASVLTVLWGTLPALLWVKNKNNKIEVRKLLVRKHFNCNGKGEIIAEFTGSVADML